MGTQYTSLIIYQFDPEHQSQGGVSTLLDDIISRSPSTEKLLVLGVSQTRALRRKVTLNAQNGTYDFIPISRVDPTNQSRIIPHSIRLVTAALPLLFRLPTKNLTFHNHRIEVAVLSSFFRARKRVYFIHTNLEKSLTKDGDSFWKRMPKLFRKLNNWVIRRSDLTVVFNKPTYEKLSLSHSQVERFRTWYDNKVFFPNRYPGNNKITVSWVGRLEAPKDPLLAIDTFASLLQQKSNRIREVELVILGDGTLREDVRKAIVEKNLSKNVRLVGAVPRSSVAEQLRNTDVNLLTSHFEGSPCVIYESLGSGTPVIATATADPDEAIEAGRNGYVVNNRSAASLAEAILNSLSIPRDTVASTVINRNADDAVAQLWEMIFNH